MKYRIVWPVPMLDRLADEYRHAKAAGLASAFTAAVYRVEQSLAADPFACGESRGSTIRIVIDAPVAIWYEADQDLMAVTIHDVRYRRPRNS
jgi:hypothetical protein